MSGIRTDLANERRELNKSDCKGLKSSTRKIGEVLIEETEISDRITARKLNLSIGKYLSISFTDPFLKTDHSDIIKAIIECLSALFEKTPKSILVLGLGNRNVTPDSIGVLTCDLVQATRHLSADPLFDFLCTKGCCVSVMATGVLSDTGIESAETAKAIVNQIKPDTVIIIDALSARRPERLCRTIQLSDSGIIPASGYGGDRPAINRELLRVPVIGIGIPTVINSGTYRADFGIKDNDDGLVLTPVNIGDLVKRCAEILSDGINSFFGVDF